MKWIEERAKFQKRFDDLSQENVQGLITELNKATGNFIARGGISQDPNNNPDYDTIVKLTQRAESIKQRYAALNDDILKYLTTEAKDNDLAGLLKENGELQKQISRLEKIQDEMKIDVTSAVARDELLRSRNTDVTRHQLFILDRPVRRGLIPYLWVLAVLFIGVGLVIFRMTMPTIIFEGGTGFSLLSIFESKGVIISLLVSALIVILFLSLKIGGVFG
jgi:hypothetical protein|uniref:Uncharacterized protein n=1 Tax=viral metagenome TaxID=1070528 RepID=A0A6C0DV86_9ZZZZ